MAIRLKVQDPTGVTLKVGGSDTARLSAESGIPLYPDEYAGAYSITPSSQTQTLQTEGLMMAYDLVIDPIPDNYGLITWNGSTLTVS